MQSDSTYFEENVGAAIPEYSARTAGVFNPVVRVLGFDGDEVNDTDDEQVVIAPDVPKLQQPESPAYALNMPVICEPESPVRDIEVHLPRSDDDQDEPQEVRVARIEEERLHDIIWEHLVIGDTLFQYEIVQETDAETRLLASQPVGVLREDSSGKYSAC